MILSALLMVPDVIPRQASPSGQPVQAAVGLAGLSWGHNLHQELDMMISCHLSLIGSLMVNPHSFINVFDR